MTTEYVDKANAYIDGVLSGRIDACKWVKLACARQRRDLERRDDPKFPYYFDPEAGNRVCVFISKLPHVKGREWAGKNIELEEWQCFLLTTIFGWLHRGTRMRRFRTVYIEVPRKNAKSTLTSGVALYMLAADGEPGAEIYAAATTKEQSQGIVFKDAKEMVKKRPAMKDRFGIEINASALTISENASIFRALPGRGETLDGLNIQLGVVDELHAHKTRAVFDVIETGTGARSQPLIWAITTAGTDTTGICYEQRSYVQKILEEITDDETYFGIIYTIDDEDEWTDPASWRKANPNYGISVYADDIERLAKKAIITPSAANNFKTKRLNVWVNANAPWINLEKLKRGMDTSLKMEDFTDAECWIGVDAAERLDIFAVIFLFRLLDEKGIRHYYLFGNYYLPEETIEESRNASYAGWVNDGYLIATEGNTADWDLIEGDVLDACQRLNVIEAVNDPWHTQQMANHLIAQGIEVVNVGTGRTADWSNASKTFEEIYISGRLHWDGNPVFLWAASNVVAHEDNRGNIFPQKDKKLPDNKVDPITAAIIAFVRAEPEDDEVQEFKIWNIEGG